MRAGQSEHRKCRFCALSCTVQEEEPSPQTLLGWQRSWPTNWRHDSGHCSLPQEGIQLGLGGRIPSLYSHFLFTPGLVLNRHWSDDGCVCLEPMSRKKLRGGLECRAGKTDTLSKAQLCHLRLQALAVGTLGTQVRAQCMSLSSVQATAKKRIQVG